MRCYPDDAEYAATRCDVWQRWKIEECVYLGVENLTPENLTNVMSSAEYVRVENCFREAWESEKQRTGRDNSSDI